MGCFCLEFVDDNRCFACGQNNPSGLRLTFQWDGDEYKTEFYTDDRFQGYTGILHGGITATILDEAMARHLTTRGLAVMTASMELRYKKPVPTGLTLRCIARQAEKNRNLYKMEAVALLPDGTVAVEAAAKFICLGEMTKKQGRRQSENHQGRSSPCGPSGPFGNG